MKSALFAALLAAPLLAQSGALAPTGLRCEYLTDPMGIDTLQPRLSWVLNHSARGQKQSAYQVVVSTDAAFSAPVWDTGKLASAQSTQVAYAGKPLASGVTYYWKVRYWDKDGAASPYSATARFDTGLLAQSDWKGKWIGDAGELRKQFTLARKPVRARVYIAAAGYYELRINGRKVGDHVLDPAWTDYDKRILYTTYDVTPLLAQGQNAIGVMLGNGWYKKRAALVQLNVELEGGERAEVVTDATWKSAPGPIVSDSVYDGETYDARLETPGWDRPDYDDGTWKPAPLVAGPTGVRSAQMMPPIRVTDSITPVKMTSPKPGVYVYDMGQNFSGWVCLRAEGPRGAKVRIRHSELLYDDGTLNVENLREAKATDYYILRGDGAEEVYEPRFTYHGFRYVEISGLPGAPRHDTVRARVVNTDVKPLGGFACSKTLLNQLQKNILWGIRSNLESIPTDCNQRDERLGWMADAHLYAETAMLNFDMAGFYTNFLRDIRDIQGADGTVTDTVPGGRWGSRPADPAWGAAYPLIAWYLYQYQGDRRILEQHYDGIKAWTDFQTTRAKDGILSYSYYGDWVPIERTPGDLVSTVFYYNSAKVTAQAAEILGKTADAAAYKKLSASIAAAFDRKFWSPGLNAYGNGNQASQILPLFFGMAPKEHAGGAAGRMWHDIVYRNDTHLTTGILATKYVMPLLAESNPDLAYELATQTSYPSWGYMIEKGATTVWELWQNKTGPSMNSHNHPMFGSVGAFFYYGLAGIALDPKAPGYERVVFKPLVVRDLRWASGSIQTLRGTVASSWRRTDEGLELEVTIPTGSTAEIHVPKLGADDPVVTESGKPVWKQKAYVAGAAGLEGAKENRGEIVFTAGSGTYKFELSGL
ncbi:MAG: family 78 glycoside hydrolase catalytic domain [Acidobacteriota bacterium]